MAAGIAVDGNLLRALCTFLWVTSTWVDRKATIPELASSSQRYFWSGQPAAKSVYTTLCWT